MSDSTAMPEGEIWFVMNEDTRQRLLLEADRMEEGGDTKGCEVIRRALDNARVESIMDDGKVLRVDCGELIHGFQNPVYLDPLTTDEVINGKEEGGEEETNNEEGTGDGEASSS